LVRRDTIAGGDAGHGSFTQERARERKRLPASAVGICLIQSVKEDKNRGKCVSSELQGEEKKRK